MKKSCLKYIKEGIFKVYSENRGELKMSKIIKLTTGALIFFSHLDQAFCYNPQFLDSLADSFNDRIYVKAPISIEQIQDNLGFLEEDDEEYVTEYSQKNVFDSDNEKIKNKSEAFYSFYNNCQKIYETYDMIDPVVQAAVQMMFERVSQKYEQHLNFLASTNHLLPTRKALAKDSSKDTHAVGEKSNDNSQSLPEISTRYKTGSANPHQRLVASH